MRTVRSMSFVTALFLTSASLSAGTRTGWEVAPLNGAPALWHDGKPVPLVLYMPHWKLDHNDIPDVAAQGFHLYDLGASFQHYSNPYWKGDGSLDTSYVESRLDLLLRQDPQATFIPRLFATAPEWWRTAHPQELIAFAGLTNLYDKTDPRTLRRDRGHRESFASTSWREGVTPYYSNLVARLYAKYGDRLAGVQVANGLCGENLGWDAWFSFPLGEVPPPYGDVSVPMQREFRRFLREKYAGDVSRLRAAWKDPSVAFESARVPGKEERERFDETGVWRDPAKGLRVPDYHECHHALTADLTAHFAGVARRAAMGRVPVLTFYGYTQDEPWSVEADHRAISRLYRCDDVHIYSSPHTYKRRKPGEDGGMRQYLASAALHGRLFIDEGDDMTHLERLKRNPDCRAFAADMEDSIHLIYREFGNTVTHGVGLWYMDLEGGFFRDPKLIDALGRMRKWSEVALRHPREHVSEVAVISNPESEFYMGSRASSANNVVMTSYIEQMGAFYSAGAPFDWYLIDDLEAVEARRYKVVVFLDCQYMKAGHLAIARRLRANGRTLVFFHAPAYVSEQDLSRERTEELTGFGVDIVKGESPLGLVESESGRTFGSGKPQRGLFVPVGRSSDRVYATGVGPLEGRPVVSARRHTDWEGVYVAVPAATSGMFRDIYRRAGVHLYTDRDVVLSANSAWVMLHTKEKGEYRVRLPQRAAKVTEVTTERTVGTDMSEFDWKLDAYRTAVFLVESPAKGE